MQPSKLGSTNTTHPTEGNHMASNAFNLEGKVALVTGANTGLG